jgi:paraquat-inducible protein A
VPEMDETETYLKACDHCDLLNEIPELSAGHVVRCSRCNGLLHKFIDDKFGQSLALSLASLVFFAIGNLFPLLTIDFKGKEITSRLLDGVWVLAAAGFTELAIIVFLSSFLIPLVILLLLIHISLGVQNNRIPGGLSRLMQLLKLLKPWAMAEIFVFGILISYVKLVDIATIRIGIAIGALFAMMILTICAVLLFDERQVWRWMREYQ